MRAALAFLTTVGGAREPAPRTFRWFPVVGLLLGAALGGIWWLAAEAWPPVLAAVVVVVADLALTGLLHVDGLADSADGLLAHHPDAARRLEVMRQPDIGAYGAAVVAITLLARVAALGSMGAEPWLLAGLWMASRTIMAVIPGFVPSARPDGLTSLFLGAPAPRWPVALLVPAALVASVGTGAAGIAAVVAVTVGATAVVLLARRRVGGFTGDVLGASALVGETVGLVVAAARW
jgi:adenosylcobinamide-GDP ribazoletransferase